MAKKKTTTKRKPKLTPEQRAKEREKKKHIKPIQGIFSTLGFKRAHTIADKQFNYDGTGCDIDDYYIYQNIHVLVEYTTSGTESISGHLKKKDFLYKKINSDPSKFCKFLENKFPSYKGFCDPLYSYDQCHLIIMYCSKNPVSEHTKSEVGGICYFEYAQIEYFKGLLKGVYKSALNEFFDFLGLSFDSIGENSISVDTIGSKVYNGSLLPEDHSYYDEGYKVVSFYIDPKSLLERAYVLRKDSWRDNEGLYQRMISNRKIKSIRNYLKDEKRVFVNNIIITMPNKTTIVDHNNITVDHTKITKTTPIKISLPNEFNSVGIIDGQHRIFSYHEGGSDEDLIRPLRIKQNLLVTGIIYPEGISSVEKTKFESQLFLEINSNQLNAKTELKQAIGLLVKPFATDSIGKKLLINLNINSPLQNLFEKHFYDKGKLKTTSVVSFGLRPLVKLKGDDCFFNVWSNPNKLDLLKEKDFDLLEEYVQFCEEEIRHFLIAIRSSLPKGNWRYDRKDESALLSTVVVNGLLICLRLIVKNRKLDSIENYKKKITGLNSFDFSKYKSSHYSRMGHDLYNSYFI